MGHPFTGLELEARTEPSQLPSGSAAGDESRNRTLLRPQIRERERERASERAMAGRLTAAGAHILGGGGAAARAAGSALRHRAGMGLPVGRHIVPDKPVSPPAA